MCAEIILCKNKYVHRRTENFRTDGKISDGRTNGQKLSDRAKKKSPKVRWPAGRPAGRFPPQSSRLRASKASTGKITNYYLHKLLREAISGADRLSESLIGISGLIGYQEYQVSNISYRVDGDLQNQN